MLSKGYPLLKILDTSKHCIADSASQEVEPSDGKSSDSKSSDSKSSDSKKYFSTKYSWTVSKKFSNL